MADFPESMHYPGYDKENRLARSSNLANGAQRERVMPDKAPPKATKNETLNIDQAPSPVQLEQQKHIDMLNLLERLERGESIDDPQLAAELLGDPLDVYLL